MPDIDHSVVQKLYEAAAGSVDWNVALGGVHNALGVSATQLFVIDKTDGRLALAENSDGSPPDAMFDYVREYHRIDPHVAYAAKLPVGGAGCRDVERPVAQATPRSRSRTA